FSEAKKRLLEKGYIQVRDGKQDSRKKIYSLTEEGNRHAAKRIMPNLREKVERQEKEIEELRDEVKELREKVGKVNKLGEFLKEKDVLEDVKRIIKEKVEED
ncbi:hypothetical protein C9439_05840, partial [archaeon SCG-AAA382B04]